MPGHEVYGFVPYWEMDAGIAEHLAETDLSTLALFSVTHRSSGRMQDNQTGYRRITGDLGQRLIRQAHKRGTRVEVVYTSFGEAKNRAFYGNDKAQSRWIKELVDFTEEQGFDGINVDVELLPADLVPAYGAWVGRLRTALRERLPDAQVSVSTTGGARGAAMAAAANAAGADRIFLMGYDYHWPGSEPGASAPMDRLDGEDRDLPWSLDRYAALGVPVEKTILGLPLYGYTWPVVGAGDRCAVAGPGDTWVPRRNLRVFEDESFDPEYNTTERRVLRGPGRGRRQLGRGLLRLAAQPDAEARPGQRPGLAGAGFWAIGYERGLPDYTELIASFAAGSCRGRGRRSRAGVVRGLEGLDPGARWASTAAVDRFSFVGLLAGRASDAPSRHLARSTSSLEPGSPSFRPSARRASSAGTAVSGGRRCPQPRSAPFVRITPATSALSLGVRASVS